MKQQFTVAACQLFDVQDDLEQSLETIIDFATRASERGAMLVCFPECYLQGYVVEERQARRRAIDLASVQFAEILKMLRPVQPTLVIGMIEMAGESLHITAVVVKRGKLLGHHRKNRLAPGERLFAPGVETPLFEVDGLRFGINICYELNLPECAAAVASQGASLVVCPCYNMLHPENAETWKEKHNAIRAERTRESGLWLLSSDVTGERDGQISYGPTAAIDPGGVVVSQVPLMQEGLLVQEILV
ncbi:MAG: carbon-nitrogen hydrolase family protein [Planctomycetota bacterium]